MIGVGARGPVAGSAHEPRWMRSVRTEARHEHGGWASIDLAALDPDAERPFWIALSLVPGVGPVGFARLLGRFGSARAAWAAGVSLLEELPRVPADAAAGLARLRREGVGAVSRRVQAATRLAGGAVSTEIGRAHV